MRVIGLFVLVVLVVACSDKYEAVNGLKYKLEVSEYVSSEDALEVEQVMMFFDSTFSKCKFDEIKSIKLDSNYYSIQLYISMEYPIRTYHKDCFPAITESISRDVFGGTIVHIFITDDYDNIIQSFPYTDDYYWKSVTLSIGNFTVNVKEPLEENFAIGLVNVLTDASSILRDSTNEFEVSAKFDQDQYTVDLFVDPNELNIDLLASELNSYNSLIFGAMFDFTDGYINLKDSRTKKNIYVFHFSNNGEYL